MNGRAVLVMGLLLFCSGCQKQQSAGTLRSLEASGNVTFVCAAYTGGVLSARNIADCPDADPVDGEQRYLFALVTQPNRGEVAVIDLSVGAVVDIEPTVPGFGFLPVGAQPVDIVTTPGGTASFVGVAEVGREGIYALPTRCVGPRRDDEPPRDVTGWPACRLPSAPGDMAVLIDPPVDDDGDPATPPRIRARCEDRGQPEVDAGGRPDAAVEARATGEAGTTCSADLSRESRPEGRRKLAVALPDRGQIAIVDAQAVLDRAPGTFEACPIDRYVSLRVDVRPGDRPVEQRLPPDLDVADECLPPGLSHGPPPQSFPSRPAGFAKARDDNRLFVADRQAPVIHVLDTSDPCELRELPPLRPVSFVDPDRIVTATELAVSPLTSDFSRFLYAIDEGGQGSVMIFDVSPESTDRTPLLRPRSDRLPFEPPDRIAFDSPAQDVEFVFRDDVIPDPTTGNAPTGVLCDPDPALDPNLPAALHRPASDFSSGARPGLLRGIFGLVALGSGQIAFIDIEDFDAACRRPKEANPKRVEDFRGCASDPRRSDYVRAGQPTVSNEASCHVVEKHRTRSANLVINSGEVGIRAPSLRALPRLRSPVGRSLSPDQSEEGRKVPKMLGVDFSADHVAQTYVGTRLFKRGSSDNSLVIDPARAEQSSLVLSFAEPRAYAPSEQFTATYEGRLLHGTNARFELAGSGTATLVDSGVGFCDHGIFDKAAMRARYAAELGVSEQNAQRFGESHADFVTITSDFIDEDDPYWSNSGASCGGADPDVPGAGRLTCRALLGTPDNPTERRELSIDRAYGSRLDVHPRQTPPSERQRFNELLACCFPTTVSYTVRASSQWVVAGALSGVRHNITTAPSSAEEPGRCVVSCNPLRSRFNGRAFEVSCSGDCPQKDGISPIGIVGRDSSGARTAEGPALACVVDDPSVVSSLEDAEPPGCVFQNLTTAFVIYRGLDPTDRDMQFSWDVIGGFSPLVVDLASVDNNASTLPQSLVFSPQADAVAVTDGETKGLTLINLGTFNVSPFF